MPIQLPMRGGQTAWAGLTTQGDSLAAQGDSLAALVAAAEKL
jgi:uncharacterized membrane protein YjdF